MAQRTTRGSARMFNAACRAAFKSVEGAGPTRQQSTWVRSKTDKRPKTDETKKFEETIKQLQEKNQKLQQEQLLKQKEILRLQSDNESLSSKLNTTEQQLFKTTAELQLTKRVQPTELEGHLEQVCKEAEEQQRKVELQYKNLQSGYQTLLLENEALLKETQRLQQENSEIMEEKRDLLLERGLLLKSKDRADITIKLLMSEKEQADQLARGYRAKIQKLTDQLESGESSMDSELEAEQEAERNNYAKSSQQKAEEIQRLQGVVAALSALLCAHQEELSKEVAERQDLQQQKSTLLQDKEDMEKRVKDLRQEKIELLKKQNKLQKENKELQESLTKTKPEQTVEQNPTEEENKELKKTETDKTETKEHKDEDKKTQRKKGCWSWWHRRK